MNISIINNEASEICEKIILDLPEYFGLPEANQAYIEGVKDKINFAAKIEKEYIGLLSLEFPYPNNANIYWMGIIRAFQGKFIGSSLLEAAIIYTKNKGAKTITVETLAPKENDENYLKTYHFYLKHGFIPMFDLKPTGYEFNMCYMVRIL